MIRPADYKDLDSLVLLVKDFFNTGGIDGTGLVFDCPSTFNFLVDVMDNDRCEIFVFDQEGINGCIAGMIYPWEFNKSITVLKEIGWFIPIEYRKVNPMAAFSLLRKLFSWGKSMGATVRIVSSHKRAESERVIKFFNNIGMKMTDSNFIGRL